MIHRRWRVSAILERLGRFEGVILRDLTTVARISPCGGSGWYITFQTAEVAIPRPLFAEILHLIDGLRPAPLPP